MLANILILLIIIAFLVMGVSRGLAKSLLNLVGLIISLTLTRYIAPMLSELVYKSFIRQGILDNLEKTISSRGVDYAAQNCFDSAPGWISGLLRFFGGILGADPQSVQQKISSGSESFSSNAAAAIEQSVGQLIMLMFAVIFSAILFFIIFLIVKKLIKHALVLFKLPVIKQVNAVLGGLLGAIEGVVFALFSTNVFYVIMTFANPAVLESPIINGSVFRFYCLFI